MGFFSSTKKKIYLDHAAATPLDPGVFDVMVQYLDFYQNPSALYASAVTAKEAIEQARERIADELETQPDTITFTAGGTEANNMAILGVARRHQDQGHHIIASAFEHASVREPLEYLEEKGFEVEYVYSVEEAISAIRPDTILISMMYVNNEVGTIFSLDELGRAVLKWRKKQNTGYPYIHTDVCQALNYLDVRVEKLHVDLLTLNASKIYGPKGTGCLFVRRDVEIDPLLFGGGQEENRRSGTENTAAIVGFGEAVTKTAQLRDQEHKRLEALQLFFAKKITKVHKGASVNGEEIGPYRIPNNLNVYFPGIEAEKMVLYLDAYGVECATGSACDSSKEGASQVLMALGLTKEQADESVRFTLGRSTTKKDLKETVKAIKRVLETM